MPILSGKARVAGIIGWPVSHSRSPRLHGFWLERHAIDGAYIPLAIRPEDFPAAVRGLVASGFAGANVTLPNKIAAFEVCDTVDATAGTRDYTDPYKAVDPGMAYRTSSAGSGAFAFKD